MGIAGRLCFRSEDFEGVDNGVGRDLTTDVFTRKTGQIKSARDDSQTSLREVRFRHTAIAKGLEGNAPKEEVSVKL